MDGNIRVSSERNMGLMTRTGSPPGSSQKEKQDTIIANDS